MSIDIQWVQILDAFGWRDNPPPEIINLAPFFLGTQNASDQQRRHWPYLILGQKLTWLLPQRALTHLGQPELGAQLAADPSQLAQVINDYDQNHRENPGQELPPHWQELVVLRDRLYIRARQNLPEISQLLDDSEQLIKDLLSAAKRRPGNLSLSIEQAEQQIMAEIEAEMLASVVSSLTSRHHRESVQLPFPWQPFAGQE